MRKYTLKGKKLKILIWIENFSPQLIQDLMIQSLQDSFEQFNRSRCGTLLDRTRQKTNAQVKMYVFNFSPDLYSMELPLNALPPGRPRSLLGSNETSQRD